MSIGQKSADTSTSAPRPPLQRNWVEALFARMKAIYLHKWSDQFSSVEEIEAATGEWAEELSGLDGEQIKAGIAYCRRELEWPPSAGQFRKASLGQLGDRPMTAGANGQAYQVLPSVAGQLTHKRSEAAKASAAEALRHMRAGLARKEQERGEADAPADPRDRVPDDVWFAARGWGRVVNPVAKVREQLAQEQALRQGAEL